jgi:magnesium-transporting ATPase (P-type)
MLRNPSDESFNSIMSFDRSINSMRHLKRPDDFTYGILSRMDFTSERRRMSILVSDPIDGHIKLYVKGADDVIKSRLDQNNQDPTIE